ncbi:DinB family protein [Aequorivita todarodis]|uniref:DinB family protein n=1 Tax=Aequorivita todarodis TaxID=2036821 RepID=UPI00234FF3BF|nr:DinB family protein [Aequorivita todarodis]MDC8002004.1 DinB family protein [Aequorivita todarodis]
MKAFFQDTFEYTHRCNQQLIEVLINNPETYSEKISLLASHTLNAHHIWNHRIFGVIPALSVWQHLDSNDLQHINNENFEHSKEILQKKELNKLINYTNSKGQNFTNAVSEILFHIVNHSTYHRGQLMSLLKAKGVEPIVTDYIFYKR